MDPEIQHRPADRAAHGADPSRGPAAEKRQRRLSRLAAPHRPAVRPFTGRLAVVIASSCRPRRSAWPAVPGPRMIDVALPQQDVALLAVAGRRHGRGRRATAAIGVVQTWISTTVGQRVMHHLRTDVFAHLQRQSVGFFTRTRGGEVQSRITNDIGGMQDVVTSTATSIASNVTAVVATAVAMAACPGGCR